MWPWFRSPDSQSAPAGGREAGTEGAACAPQHGLPQAAVLVGQGSEGCQARCGLWGRRRGTVPLPSTIHGVQRHRLPPPPPDEKPRPGREGSLSQVPHLKSGCQDSNSGLALCPVLLPPQPMRTSISRGPLAHHRLRVSVLPPQLSPHCLPPETLASSRSQLPTQESSSSLTA